MQALTTEWPLCDPQYVLNELREVPSFYKTYKIWTKLEKYKKSARIKWNEFSEEVRKGIASMSVTIHLGWMWLCKKSRPE